MVQLPTGQSSFLKVPSSIGAAETFPFHLSHGTLLCKSGGGWRWPPWLLGPRAAPLERVSEFSVQGMLRRDLVKSVDLTKPHVWYPVARALKRNIIYHSGPTNSGKTYSALQARFERNTPSMFYAQ